MELKMPASPLRLLLVPVAAPFKPSIVNFMFGVMSDVNLSWPV